MGAPAACINYLTLTSDDFRGRSPWSKFGIESEDIMAVREGKLIGRFSEMSMEHKPILQVRAVGMDVECAVK
jgi:hypothetical protein